jgi:hypothetical protein
MVAPPPPPSARPVADRLAPKLYLLWAGLAIGVAFLATPAKFLAPSLTLPVALDVGRYTFRVYNGVEVGLLVCLAAFGLWSCSRWRWYLRLAVPAAVVLAQAFWLIPELDVRVAAIQGGAPQAPLSNLHSVYVTAEVIKVLWLLGAGLVVSASPGPRTDQESPADAQDAPARSGA